MSRAVSKTSSGQVVGTTLGTALVLMAVSGGAALAYQVVWTEQCALGLGHEMVATLVVMTAFFAGLGLGATALGRTVSRSAHPGRWYVGCEVFLALWALLLAGRLGTVSQWLSQWGGTATLDGVSWRGLWRWGVMGLGLFVVLLPATAAMGLTLPAMERLLPDDHPVASLYAANTLGAVVGTLGSAFWCVPGLGLSATARVAAALNLACGLIALAALPLDGPSPLPPEIAAASFRTTDAATSLRQRRLPLLRLAVLGFLGIGYQVVVVRVLAQVSEDTVYTFAALLAIDLAGTAAGAAVARRWGRGQSGLRRRAPLLVAASCLLGTASLWAAPALGAWVHRGLGHGVWSALVAEVAPGVLALGAPAFFMGALFCFELQAACASGLSVGVALGANTGASAFAPAFWGVLALPAWGPKGALVALASAYLLLLPWPRRRRARASAPAIALALAIVIGAAPRLAFVEIPPGGRLVSYEDGAMAAVSVVEDADGVARLRINDRAQEGSSATLRVDARQAWLPLLLHERPHTVLFLGLGTGVTAHAAAADPSLEVTAVELLPEVVRASQFFASSSTGDSPGRLRVVEADARRFVRLASDAFDVIVSDNFHPARSGSASLYTAEHFALVRQRLAPGGVFCQWLPLHQLDLASLRSIVHSFLIAFPRGAAILASNSLETPVVGLVARRDGERWRIDALAATRPAYGLDDRFAVLGSFIAGPSALQDWAKGAPANTDDRPLVAHLAPRLTYAPRALPRDRLLALAHAWSIAPGELFGESDAEAASTVVRLQAYWRARDRFLALGRDVRVRASAAAMLAEVGGPLLELLHESPDFRPAYDPLLAMASALTASDREGARALLVRLISLQPSRPEAAEALAASGLSPVDQDDLQQRRDVGFSGRRR